MPAELPGAAAPVAPAELIAERLLNESKLALGLVGEDGERSEPPAAGRGGEAAALML